MDYYTPQEYADMVKLDLRTVFRLFQDGRLKAEKVGRQYRILKRDLPGIRVPELVDKIDAAPGQGDVVVTDLGGMIKWIVFANGRVLVDRRFVAEYENQGG